MARLCRCGRWRLVPIALALVLSAPTGCKRKSGEPSPAAAQTALPKPPAELLTYLAMRAPADTLDRTLGLVRKFVPLPLDRSTLVSFALQRTGLPPTLVEALDLKRTVWFLALDAELLAEPEPSVLALPIRSAEALQKVLTAHFVPIKKDAKGPLRHWRAKPGHMALGALMLSVQDGYAVIPSSEKALAKAGSYLRQALLKQRPQHDLELHVGHREDARTEERLKKALQGLTRRLDQPGTDALQRALTDGLVRYTKLLWTAEHLTVWADVGAEGPMLGMTARGGDPKGELARLIKGERTGLPWGSDLLPDASWLVLARHGSASHGGSTSGGLSTILIDGLTEDLAPEMRTRLRTAAQQLRSSLGESGTLALHRPVDQGGLGVLYVAQVANRPGVEKSMQRLTGLLQEAARREQKRSRESKSSPPEVKTRVVNLLGASGAVSELVLPDGLVADPRFSLPRLVGSTLALAWAIREDVVLFASGKGAEAHLERAIRILAKKAPPEPFVRSRRFRGALGEGATRNGVLYLSLVDLVRSAAGLGYAEVDMLAAGFEKAKVQTALSVDWGVDQRRRTYQLRAFVPLAHLLHFRPLLQGLGSAVP